MAIPVIVRMFVAPLPVLRLFFRLQSGEVLMRFVLSFFPHLVGTAFVVVPVMAILMVAVIVSVGGAVVILMLIIGVGAHGCNQDRTQKKRT